MMKIATKKIESTFSISLAAIFVIQFLPSQLQDPRICNIASSSNIFENFNFQKCLTKTQYCQFKGPVIGVGEG